VSSHDAVPREGATAASVTRKTPGKKGAPEPAPLGAVVGEHWRARSVLRTLPDDQNTGLWRTLNQVYAELPGQRPEEISGQLRTIVLPSYQTWCTARRAAQRFGAPLASPIARNPPPTPSPPKLMCVAQLDNCALTSAVCWQWLYITISLHSTQNREEPWYSALMLSTSLSLPAELTQRSTAAAKSGSVLSVCGPPHAMEI